MRTTLNIDEDLLDRAGALTGIREKTALVRAGLEALIAREAARCTGRYAAKTGDYTSTAICLMACRKDLRWSRKVAGAFPDASGYDEAE